MRVALATSGGEGFSRADDIVRATEILEPGEALMEMSIGKKKAEQIVSGLEQPINLHLLKLLGCRAEPEMRQHWKREPETWLLRIAALTLKPDNAPYRRSWRISGFTMKRSAVASSATLK